MSVVGSLWSRFKEEIKPQNPTGNNVADTVTAVNNAYSSLSPLLPKKVREDVKKTVNKVKQGIIKSEVQAQGQGAKVFIEKNIVWLFLLVVGYLFMRKNR